MSDRVTLPQRKIVFLVDAVADRMIERGEAVLVAYRDEGGSADAVIPTSLGPHGVWGCVCGVYHSNRMRYCDLLAVSRGGGVTP